MKNILVLCTGNSCRSQIAEGYLKNFLKGRAVIYSAGTDNHQINKKAVNIMKEDGIDISMHTSNNVLEYKDISFDFVITVCDNANETCPTFLSKKAEKLHKNFFDPSSVTDPVRIESAYRECRDKIKRFCFDFSKKFN